MQNSAAVHIRIRRKQRIAVQCTNIHIFLYILIRLNKAVRIGICAFIRIYHCIFLSCRIAFVLYYLNTVSFTNPVILSIVALGINVSMFRAVSIFKIAIIDSFIMPLPRTISCLYPLPIRISRLSYSSLSDSNILPRKRIRTSSIYIWHAVSAEHRSAAQRTYSQHRLHAFTSYAAPLAVPMSQLGHDDVLMFYFAPYDFIYLIHTFVPPLCLTS